MTTPLDSSGIYVCIRGPIIGYGDTLESAKTMADAIEAMQAKRGKRDKIQRMKDATKTRYRLNPKTIRYEIVAECHDT